MALYRATLSMVTFRYGIAWRPDLVPSCFYLLHGLVTGLPLAGRRGCYRVCYTGAQANHRGGLGRGIKRCQQKQPANQPAETQNFQRRVVPRPSHSFYFPSLPSFPFFSPVLFFSPSLESVILPPSPILPLYHRPLTMVAPRLVPSVSRSAYRVAQSNARLFGRRTMATEAAAVGTVR